jgi:hypothetical protein
MKRAVLLTALLLTGCSETLQDLSASLSPERKAQLDYHRAVSAYKKCTTNASTPQACEDRVHGRRTILRANSDVSVKARSDFSESNRLTRMDEGSRRV